MSQIKITFPYLTINEHGNLVAIPLSKNKSHKLGTSKAGNRPRRFRTKEYSKQLDEIIYLIKAELNKHNVKFLEKKVYIDVMVYKNGMHNDPINFLDGIADAVKLGINVDDRNFSGSWDWEIDKENPRFELEIRQ